MEKVSLNHLGVEITRRCNIQCKHCIRGERQNIDIDPWIIDELLDKVKHIEHFCPTGGEPLLHLSAIEYFIKGIKKRNITIGGFYISTNGIGITQRFVNICNALYEMALNKKRCWVQISNDKYHLDEKQYDDSLIKDLPFYSKRTSDGNTLQGKVAFEGLAKKNNLKEVATPCIPDKGELYMNVNGDFVLGSCWSYESQEEKKFCSVNDFEKYIAIFK